MTPIKALFLDVDGTLLSFATHQVPSSALEALQKAHDSGVHIIIATGRAATDLHGLEAIPYEAIVAMNGAECVLRDGTTIAKNTITKADFLKVLTLSQQYDFALALETNDGVIVNRLSPAVIELAELVAHPIPRVADLEQEFDKRPCCQMCIYCDQETEDIVMAKLPGLVASRWNPIFADVNVANVNKAIGLQTMAGYYGIDLAETMAFGDGGNDIPMLKAAGIGVAMGNASDTVKAAARFVTAHVDDHGIQKALMQWGVI